MYILSLVYDAFDSTCSKERFPQEFLENLNNCFKNSRKIKKCFLVKKMNKMFPQYNMHNDFHSRSQFFTTYIVLPS